MSKTLLLEISGICNAHCKWCVTGSGETKTKPAGFMSADACARILPKLSDEGMLTRKTTLLLYNWGEPFLNPELRGILKQITHHGHKFILSTNASRYIDISEYQGNLGTLIISMPGFSQDSYTKIHGFSFAKILNNIENFMEDINSRKIIINFHLYKWNHQELEQAIAFFSEHGVSVYPYFAFFNNYNQAIQYLNKTLPPEILAEASKDLELEYVETLLSKTSEEYHCPEWDRPSFDEFGRRITCCVIPKSHPHYLYSPDMVACDECIKSGEAYWSHNVQTPDFAKKLQRKYFLQKLASRWLW